MSKVRRFTVTVDKIKKAVAQKLELQYEDIEVGFTDDDDDFVITVKRGILTEAIKITDDIAYEIFNVDKNILSFESMCYSNSYSFRCDEPDENIIIEIYAKELSDLKEVA